MPQILGTRLEIIERIIESRVVSDVGATPTVVPDVAKGPDDTIARMKVADLKAQLSALGHSVTGNKAELQSRLRAIMFLAEDNDAGLVPADPNQKQLASSPRKGSHNGTDKKRGAATEELHDGENIGAKVRMTGGPPNVTITVDKSQRRKGTDELGMTRQDREQLMQKCVRSLYRRCLRSAERCPDEKWQETMLHYVRGRFRDTSSDGIPLRLSLGESELQQMESYHHAREEAAARKRRQNS